MDEADAGRYLIAFDGRVLELFNRSDGASSRYHVRRIDLTVHEPDRKGRVRVSIRPREQGGATVFEVSPEEAPMVLPILERVRAAIAASVSSRPLPGD